MKRHISALPFVLVAVGGGAGVQKYGREEQLTPPEIAGSR